MLIYLIVTCKVTISLKNYILVSFFKNGIHLKFKIQMNSMILAITFEPQIKALNKPLSKVSNK